MRKAFNDYGFLIHDEEFIGISLGYDFCAEHEWGFDELKDEFNIPKEKTKKNLGIKSRIIRNIPETLKFRKDGKDGAALWIQYSLFDNVETKEFPDDLKNYKERIKTIIKRDEEICKQRERDYGKKYHRKLKDPMISAWDWKSFGIAVYGKKEVEWLEQLYQEMKRKNVAITPLNLSGDNPFANASLSIIIVDQLPKTIIDAFYHSDKKQFDLNKYEKKIGMKKIIEKYEGEYKQENYFMACLPSWINYDDKVEREKRKKELNTKYDIQYWINYSDDDRNMGWYSVEEIRKWLTTDGLKLTDICKN